MPFYRYQAYVYNHVADDVGMKEFPTPETSSLLFNPLQMSASVKAGAATGGQAFSLLLSWRSLASEPWARPPCQAFPDPSFDTSVYRLQNCKPMKKAI